MRLVLNFSGLVVQVARTMDHPKFLYPMIERSEELKLSRDRDSKEGG